MHRYRDLIEFAAVLDIRLAIVKVQAGETDGQAWQRHLEDHPHDAQALVKIFCQLR